MEAKWVTTQTKTQVGDKIHLEVKRHQVRAAATDPPVDQPNSVLVLINEYCVEPLNLTVCKLTQGGWKTPPEEIVPPMGGGIVQVVV